MNKIDFFEPGAPAAYLGSPAPRRHYLTPDHLIGLLEFFDVLLIVGAGILANFIRFGAADVSGVRGMALILAAFLAWTFFRNAKLHDQAVLASALGQSRRALTALAMVFLAMLAIGYATKTWDSISRLWVGLWFVCALGLVAATRPAVARIYRKHRAAGMFLRRLAVCSSGRNAERLEQFLQRWQDLGSPSHELVGLYLDDVNALGDRLARWRHLIRGSIDDLLRASARGLVDDALVVIRPRGCDNMEPVIQKLRSVSIDVDLLAGDVDPVWANRPVGKIAGLPVMGIMRRPLNETQVLLKRSFDLVVATIAFPIAFFLTMVIASAIKATSPGPVIFRQYRHGFNNRPFQVYKFRTMYDSPEADKNVPQARRNDPRVTPVGAFLRKTSLDELPQLINVFRGEMSIVGPRPHACEHNNQFAKLIDSYLGRHRIKPGITGWAQVNGYRGETDTVDKMRKRVEYDLYYADHWSIVLDIKILFLTLGCLIHRNAY